MKVIGIINLKGGVGKTVSAINIAYILKAVYKKRVLLIDNDKQGNTTKFFGRHSYDHPSIADLLTCRVGLDDVVCELEPDLSLIPANMSLLTANSSLLIDTSRSRDYRLRRALETAADRYDYCVVDCAPDINISVINTLMAADDLLIPLKIDRFSFDGLKELSEQINDVRESNRHLRLAGCFFTMYQRNRVNEQGDEWLREGGQYPVFRMRIRSTVKVTETTYAGQPLMIYSPKCSAAQDYLDLVAEYLDSKGGAADGQIQRP